MDLTSDSKYNTIDILQLGLSLTYRLVRDDPLAINECGFQPFELLMHFSGTTSQGTKGALAYESIPSHPSRY